MELFKASQQWSTRPADERFGSLQALYDACKKYASEAKERKANFSDLRVEAINGDVQLVGKSNTPAKLTNWAFGQLCARLSAPASYLRDLPATLACQNLNHGLAMRAKEIAASTMNPIANLLFHSNGSLLLRCITTDDYKRIWNWEVCERLLDLQGQGWAPAMPTTHWDMSVPVGNCIMCAGTGNGTLDHTSTGQGVQNLCKYCNGTGHELPPLYASDRDMFAFLSNSAVTIEEKGRGAIYRGIIVENSEVGASALKLTRFLYREICGNHIIWGASEVVDVSLRHVGNARDRWSGYLAAVKAYAEESASETEAKIAWTRNKLIGDSKENVLDALFGRRGLNVSKATLDASFDACVPSEDGDPRTVWGFVQGMTRYSQTIPYANERTQVDKAAGKVLDWF